VEVRARGLSAPTDDADDVALADRRAGARPVLLVVGVDGRVAVVVLEDHEVAVAAEVVAVEDASGARRPHRRSFQRADVDPVVMALPARAERRAHDAGVHGPDERRGPARQLGRGGTVARARSGVIIATGSSRRASGITMTWPTSSRLGSFSLLTRASFSGETPYAWLIR
jgi:hypothetical protein